MDDKKTNNFIKKAKKVHGNKYDYSLVEIKENWNEKVKIVCEKHGMFEQRCVNHISGSNGGCKGFKITKKRDNIKNEFCRKNKIKLIRIKYNENIKEKIEELRLW